MEVCPDGKPDVEFGEVRLKAGVTIDSVAAGDENEEGVEACSVAKRSGVGVEAELRRLHPRMKTRTTTIQKSFDLFIIQFY